MKINRLIFLVFLLFSCQEEVILELREEPSNTVIEGFWTDTRSLNQVRITKSRGYYDSSYYQPISNAKVSIYHHERNREIEFFFSSKTETYLPGTNLDGEEGEHYTLKVKVGNNEYESSGELLEAPELDSLSYSYHEKQAFRPAGYYLKLHGNIPFEENNYYRIRVVRNDTLLNRKGDYLLFDDTFGTGVIEDGFELDNIPFKKGDEAKVTLFRLNKSAYNYLQDLVGLLYNDGGLFSPPPQNPQSNIELVKGQDPALGYFMVSPVISESITIQ
ncbi:DUF4249 domain-containing protein [Echinicola sp. CAU 1574]|uniref:DUF4249 domain-containing protein n=1 Tax=Echinicola arenosa TaxID=2774144 RepID=A0ABR9APS6_9BACT|nr:DUF4249 family protein [Echinicola arenosa]MBD8490792.1 DUF4249 domain-containing protein [Echinicola arenosa]